MNKKEKINGLIAGISLIIMAVAAGFSYGYVQEQMIGETAVLTAQNLAENKGLFSAGLGAWVVILITDVIVAFALMLFFRNTNWQISKIAGAIRLVYTLVLGIAIYRLFSILPLIDQADSAGEISTLIDAFENIWSIGLIIFGLHLIVLGYLSVKSKHLPRLLGYLLYFGGAAYTLIHSSKQLALAGPETMASIETVLALPMALSEILLAFWLIYKGFQKSKELIKQ